MQKIAKLVDIYRVDIKMGCVDVKETVHMVQLRGTCVCDVTHEWVSYPSVQLRCGIPICHAVTPCEQFHKIACKKMQSHSERIAPCEQALITFAIL